MGKELSWMEKLRDKIRRHLTRWLGIQSAWVELDKLRESLRFACQRQVELEVELHEALSENAVVHIDHHARSESWIIVIGRFQNRDYINAFRMDSTDFKGFVGVLKRQYPRARLGQVDTPHPEFRGWFEKEW